MSSCKQQPRIWSSEGGRTQVWLYLCSVLKNKKTARQYRFLLFSSNIIFIAWLETYSTINLLLLNFNAIILMKLESQI